MTFQIRNPLPMAHRNLIFACGVAYLGALSFGYMIGYTSPSLPNMVKDGKLNEDEGSMFASIATIGALLGCPIAGWLVEKVGRQQSLVASAFPFLAGWLLIVFSPSTNILHLGRILTGLSSGMTCVCSPLYVAEVAPKELRGLLGSGVQLGVTVGILLVYALGLVFSWKALAMVGSLLAISTVVLSLRIYETPRFLLMKGEKQATLRALAWFRGPTADIDEECRDIEESLPDKEDTFKWSELKKPELYLPLKVSMIVMFFQQFSGINVVMFYTVTIFQNAGYKENGELAAMVIGAVQVLATVGACVMMDRAGRRQLLIISGLGMAVTCGTFGIYYQQINADPTKVDTLSWLAMLSLVVYIVAFSFGWGPIPMLVMSEVFPVRARGVGSAMASATNWSCAFLLTKQFPFLVETLGSAGTFFTFGVFCLLSVVFVFFNVPETKGKSLEDIELYFLGRTMRGK